MADFFTTTAVVDKAACAVKNSTDAHIQDVASVAEANKPVSTQGASTSGTNFSMCEIIM
ncbi:hypothetical protein BDV93DRAFT_520480 [Ceratobasidium sp. AG-I]|nr:hypothetical protein BDV93DRAFT_520480 [Ceratobasidium sp. AG-I]